jgi:hypothetical protein
VIVPSLQLLADGFAALINVLQSLVSGENVVSSFYHGLGGFLLMELEDYFVPIWHGASETR